MLIYGKSVQTNSSELDIKPILKSHTFLQLQQSDVNLQLSKLNFYHRIYKANNEDIKETIGKKSARCASVFSREQRPNFEKIINSLKHSKESIKTSAHSFIRKKPKPLMVSDVQTFKKECNNLWFWYYKDSENPRDSCKSRNYRLLPELNRKRDIRLRPTTRNYDINSIRKEIELKKANDLSKYAFTEFKLFDSNREFTKFNFKPTKLSEKSENFYKIEQKIHNENFFSRRENLEILPEQLNSSNANNVVESYHDNYKTERKFELKKLSIERLKKLKIDERLKKIW